MKKILFISIFISAALLAGCENGNGTGGGDDFESQTLTISTNSVVFDVDGEAAAGSTNSVTVTSSAEWRLAGDTSWCTPSAIKGNSGAAVTFTPGENETEGVRSVNLYFICGDAAQKITVSQAPEGFVEFKNMNDSYTYASSGGLLTVKLDSNLNSANSETSDGWINLYRPAGNTSGAQWVQFSIDPTTSFTDREGSITMFKGTDIEKDIAINQTKFTGVLTDDPVRYEVGPAAGKFTITARGNVDFNVSITAANNWITSTLLSSSGTDIIEKTFEISYTDCAYDRTGTFTISPTSGTSVSVSVIQVNPNPDLFEIPDAVFANRLVDLGYFMADGDKYKLTYSGFNATSITITGQSYVNMESIEGIEKFVNLTTLRIEDCKLKKADLSQNTKITSLNLTYVPMEELILGDINIASYANNNYMYAYYANTVRSQSFKASSSKLTTISINHTSTAAYDEIEWVDITECPALTTLNCNRNNNKLQKIYVTQAQKDAYDGGTLTIVTNASFDKATGIVVK